MAKKSCRHRKHSHCKHRRHHTRKQRGGDGATGYGMQVNGLGSDQFARTFSLDGEYGKLPAVYVGAQGQNANSVNAPTAANLELIQSAGKRMKGKRSRGRKGGFIGPVISQALAPAILLGLQQSYGHKSNTKHRKSFRRR